MMDFQAARYLIDNEVPEAIGNEHPYSIPMRVVGKRDGHINLAIGGDRHWKSLCTALEQPHWAIDPEFATAETRFKNRELVWQNIQPLFAQKKTKEWVQYYDEFSLPVELIYRMDEVFADPQVKHLGIAQE